MSMLSGIAVSSQVSLFSLTIVTKQHFSAVFPRLRIWHKLVTDRNQLIDYRHSKMFMVMQQNGDAASKMLRAQVEEVNKKPRQN